MENELVVWGAVKEICSTVNTLITTYKQTHLVSKTQKQAIAIRINGYLAMERSRAVSEVARSNIQEIAKTMQLIDHMNLKGRALDMAMDMLDIQHRELAKIVEDCANGF